MSVRTIWILFISLFVLTAAHAQETNFTLGNNAYEQGNYSEALDYYKGAEAEGASANLMYNMANTYYQLGEYGQAVRYLEKAKVLKPDHPDANANLAFVRQQIELPATSKPWYKTYAHSLSVNSWALGLTLGGWILLLTLYHAVVLRKFFLWHGIGSALGGVLMLVALSGLTVYHFEGDDGFVLYGDTALKHAPTSSSPADTYLYAGERVTPIDTHEDYIQVKTNSGGKGWISADSFGKLYE